VLQRGLLVEKLSVAFLRDRFEKLLRSEKFCAYVNRCNVANITKPLLIAYLFYNEQIIQPSEGRETIHSLFELLTQTWTDVSKS
jgi:hypothetical protein